MEAASEAVKAGWTNEEGRDPCLENARVHSAIDELMLVDDFQ